MQPFLDLVLRGEERAGVTLAGPLRPWLVQCLLEHLADPEVVHETLALGFLKSSGVSGREGIHLLRRVGDGALLLEGFFPEQALRRRVSSHYFTQMGQSAYASIAARLFGRGLDDSARFYGVVARDFETLTRVLRSARARPDDWVAFRRLLLSFD